MSAPKLVLPRFYFDADVLGLAKLLAQERVDFTFPGDPGGRIKKRWRDACPITSPAALDAEWIPVVAAQGWLIITRDAAIQRKVAEIDAVRVNGAKMVNLSGEDARSTWGQLEILLGRWREIEPLVDQPGPFIKVVTRTGALRDVDLGV